MSQRFPCLLANQQREVGTSVLQVKQSGRCSQVMKFMVGAWPKLCPDQGHNAFISVCSNHSTSCRTQIFRFARSPYWQREGN